MTNGSIEKGVQFCEKEAGCWTNQDLLYKGKGNGNVGLITSTFLNTEQAHKREKPP